MKTKIVNCISTAVIKKIAKGANSFEVACLIWCMSLLSPAVIAARKLLYGDLPSGREKFLEN